MATGQHYQFTRSSSLDPGTFRIKKVAYFWNDAELERGVTHRPLRRSYDNAQVAIKMRPPNSTILSANVYGDVGNDAAGKNRLFGTATFHVQNLLTRNPVSSPVTRTGGKNGTLTLKNYEPEPLAAAHMGKPIGNTIDEVMRNGGAVRFKSSEEYNKWYKENPDVSKSMYGAFKTPFFAFGKTMVPYAAFPDLLKPEAPSPRDFHQKSLDIAKQRLNLPGSVMNRSTNDKTRLLSGMLSAWSVSTPYSIEENPAKIGRPAEQFAPARVRGLGDCEDYSWETMTNFRELLDLNTGGNLELSVMKKHAELYTAMMTLGSAMSASASGRGGGGGGRVAHMYTTLVPNDTLISLGLPIGGRTAPRNENLLLALVEGTGYVEPLQYRHTPPTHATSAGLDFTDRMIKESGVVGARRPIYLPPSKENGHIVAGYYDDIVSAYIHGVGVVDIRTKDGKLGGKLADLMDGKGAQFKLRADIVPGTNPDRWNGEERRVVNALLGLHQPVMPLSAGTDTVMPVNTIVPFIREQFAPPPNVPITRPDTVILLPYQEMQHSGEKSLHKFLTAKKNDIAWVTYTKQEIGGGGIGALQLNVKLRGTNTPSFTRLSDV